MSDGTPRAERAQRQDLQALHQTSGVLSSSLDLGLVLSNLLLTAMSKLLVMRGIVLMRDGQQKPWHVAVAKGGKMPQVHTELGLPAKWDGRMLSGDEVPTVLAELGIKIAMPIRAHDKDIGIFGLGAKATGAAFDDAEREFVQSLVNMSATAVHNCLTVKKLNQANLDLSGKVQQLDTLFDLSKKFNNANLDREPVLKTLSRALMGQLLVRRYAFYLKRGNTTFELVLAKGVTGPDLDTAYLAGLCDSRQVDTESAGGDPLGRLGLALALPIEQQGEVHGILCLGPKASAQSYGKEDVEFLYSLGSMALTSLRNIELIEESIEKRRLEEELRTARGIQQRLLPGRIPSAKGLEIATLALPSREV